MKLVTKLQKPYKSFRTNKQIADCAILVQQRWWELLDFAELRRSSVSFFNLEKNETAISRWSRARTRAAKLGKGLSKTDKAQKLALQHWLEAIDPRHRYGHNLHLYYIQWLHSESSQPFFYWLDVGEGKEVNLVDKCPRSKLQLQCIKYLGPLERKPYEVVIVDGNFLHEQTQELLHTTEAAKWIFVLSTSKTLYVGKKKKGRFQHSSFLAGGATIAAGRIVTENGTLKAVWPHSGHYRTTEDNFMEFVSFLKENNVDLTDVKMTHVNEEGCSSEGQRSRKHLRCNSFEGDLAETLLKDLETEDMHGNASPSEEDDSTIERESGSAVKKKYLNFRRKLAHLEVPKHDVSMESSSGNEQLGMQLSCRWTTGAGPHIGFVRDDPSQLQLQALEEVNMYPRSRSSNVLSPRLTFPTSFTQEMTSHQNSPSPGKGITCRDVSLPEYTPLPLIY